MLTNLLVLFTFEVVTNQVPVSVTIDLCNEGPGCLVFHGPHTNYVQEVKTNRYMEFYFEGKRRKLLL